MRDSSRLEVSSALLKVDINLNSLRSQLGVNSSELNKKRSFGMGEIPSIVLLIFFQAFHANQVYAYLQVGSFVLKCSSFFFFFVLRESYLGVNPQSL